jgi:hypothetical protein
MWFIARFGYIVKSSYGWFATFSEFFRLAKHHKIPEQKNTPICTPHTHTCMYPHTHTRMNRDIRVRIRIQNIGERILGTQTYVYVYVTGKYAYAYASRTYAYAHALSVRQSSKPMRRRSASPVMNFLVPFVNPFLVFFSHKFDHKGMTRILELASWVTGYWIGRKNGKLFVLLPPLLLVCSCCIHLQVSASSSSSILVLWCFFCFRHQKLRIRAWASHNLHWLLRVDMSTLI